jgi:hypothetical protein
MIQLIILLETILIIFWIDIEYDTSETKSTTMIINSQSYSSSKYNSLDIVGNNILIFDKISDEDKISIWLESSLKDEMLSYSPNIQIMEDFFNDRVEDNGKFKSSFLNYMRETHDEYIGTLITKEEFEEKISNPTSFSVADY